MRWRYEIADQRICRAYPASACALCITTTRSDYSSRVFGQKQNSYRFMMKHRWNEWCRKFCLPWVGFFRWKASGGFLPRRTTINKKRLPSRNSYWPSKKERLERLIAALEQAEKGGITMSAQQRRIGNRPSAVRRRGKTALGWHRCLRWARQDCGYSKNNGTMRSAVWMESSLSSQIAKIAGESVDSDTAQRLVKKLQDYITEHFYHCTDEILAGLSVKCT